MACEDKVMQIIPNDMFGVPMRNLSVMMSRGKNPDLGTLPDPAIPTVYPIMRTHLSIMGGHGVGKSTIALGLWDVITGGALIDDYMLDDFGDDSRINAHAYHNLLLMLGKYGVTRKCGGMDSIPTSDDRLYRALDAAFSSPQVLTIGEGALINSMKMMEWFDDNACKYGRNVVVLHLAPSEDIQFDRIEGRSGKKRSDLVGNGKHVIRKNVQFVRVAEWIPANCKHVTLLEVNSGWHIANQLVFLVDTLQHINILWRNP